MTFVSGTEPTKVQLEPGEYTLTEITAPQGYEVAETISFTVDKNGLVGSDKVEMKDAPIEEVENPYVTISKTDAATSEELPGAELIIRNAEGKIVESWVSTTEPTLVQLAPGEYTLTEITAPDGYEVAETIKFTVNEDGLVGSDKVEMVDAPITKEEKEEGTMATTVTADGKTASAENPAEIDLGAYNGTVTVTDHIVYTNMEGGATYVVTGELMKIVDGVAVDTVATVTQEYTADASGSGEWTMYIGNVQVEQDVKYVVYETAVNKADAEDTVEHKNPEDTAQTVKVLPYEEIERFEVLISKADAVTSAELPGARLYINNGAGVRVAEWTSGTTPYKVSLAPGTYTLTEITAPDGYDVAETITFTVTEHGVAGGKVTMYDAKTPVPENPENPIVEISKQDTTNGNELPGAELIVTNNEGVVVAHWVSTEETHKIHLAPGTYTLTELTAPFGYMQAESIVFTVDANGLVGSDKVTMIDDAISGEKVNDEFGIDIILNKTWTDADGNTVAWPEGKTATFTLQYYNGTEWKNYINYGQPWMVTLDAANPSYTFYDLPARCNNGYTMKYRAVETKLEGYEAAISSETDLDNKVGSMNAVNKPETTTNPDDEDKQKPTDNEDEKTNPTGEKEEGTAKPSDEKQNPNNENPSSQGTPDEGTTTPGTTPGRITTGTSVPTTTRRTVTTPTASGASTVSSSKATATGDNNSNIMWIVAAAMAAAAIAGAAVAMRRRRHED